MIKELRNYNFSITVAAFYFLVPLAKQAKLVNIAVSLSTH